MPLAGGLVYPLPPEGGNLEEARLSVFRYIETFYNAERIHETLDYLSPDAYEAENAPAVAA